MEKREKPEPRQISLNDGLNPDWHNDLVSLDVLLVEIESNFDGEITLLCRSAERIFEAKLPADFESPSFLKIGAKLRLTGICDLIANRDPRWQYFTKSLSILVRKDNGIQSFWRELRGGRRVGC